MVTSGNVIAATLPPAWRAALEGHGFRQCGNAFKRGRTKFRRDGRWIQLDTSGPAPGPDSPSTQQGQCGLWKWVGENGHGRRVFQIPASILSTQEPDDPEEERASLDSIIDWAVAAAKNKLPRDWQPPDRSTVESWLSPGGLDWQSGPYLGKGELVVAPDRWALQFPVVNHIPTPLPPAREALFQDLIEDANARWKLVRLELRHTAEGRVLLAVVDLTGAPHSQALLVVGLEALRHVVTWLVEAADLLGYVTGTPEVLEIGSN